jgi:DNA polymerase-1
MSHISNLNSQMKKLFLIDAMSLIFRAYYALNKNPRINSKGLNTSAILGFANSLYDVIKNETPTHIGVAFDSHGPTVRHADFTDYKANRDNTPEDIVASLPYIKRLIECFGIPVLEMPGYEADDIIGTIAKKAEKEGFTSYLMTTDKDYGQLVSQNIFIYKPAHSGNGVSVLGVKEVCEKYAIEYPEQLIDILGLWGDSVDNIPGIKGIGEVGAKKLIAEFGSIENMLDKVNQVKNDKLREKIISGEEDALLSKMLATIILDVPVDFDEEEFFYTQPNEEKLKELFDELEFRALAQRIFTDMQFKKTNVSVGKKGITNSSSDLFASFGGETAEVFVETEKKSLYETEKNYTLIKSYNEVQDLVENLKHSKSICFDTETSGLDPLNCRLVGLSVAVNPHEAFYISFPKDKGETLRWLELLRPIFNDENILKIGQNIKFDMRVLSAYNIDIQGKLFDTMLAHYVLEPEMRHNLDLLAKTYLDYTTIAYDDIVPKNGTIEQVPLEKLSDYACEDADIALQLKSVLENKMQTQQIESLFYDIEMPLVPILAAMENKGVKIDVPFLKTYSADLQVEIEQIQREIYQLAGEEFNIASPKQLGVILFEKLHIIENAKLTKSKQYQTGEEVLQKLEHKHPIVHKILNYRGLTKLKSTYVDAFPLLVNADTGRVHASFNQAITATGRLSSSNPNLQNIPIREEEGRRIREAFVPADDRHILLAADYSQIELRLVAALSEDESMLDAFYNGDDIHASTASKIYNVPLESVTSSMRRNAKMVNFGIVYGISAFGLSERLNIPRKEADNIIKQYFVKYPKIQQYIQNQIEFARQHGYVETLMKRRRYLRNINSGNGNIRSFDERNAINAPIQGSAADMIKIAMINIFREMRRQKLQSEMILQIHDELVFDVFLPELEIMQNIVHHQMTHAMTLTVPLEINMKTGGNWLEAH